MKKTAKKLVLAKETLCELDSRNLEEAVGRLGDSGWYCKLPQATSLYCTI
jgi:hypothetical protein